jgi:type IV secretion system protein VirB3
MADTGTLRLDPLFVGLTRPTMIFGVSFKFVMLNMLISLMYFINTTDLKIFLFTPLFHGIGYAICFKEPLFLELIAIKMQKCNRCKNKLFYGANSYDLYPQRKNTIVVNKLKNKKITPSINTD